MYSCFAPASFYTTLLPALLDVCSCSRPPDTFTRATRIPTWAGPPLASRRRITPPAQQGARFPGAAPSAAPRTRPDAPRRKRKRPAPSSGARAAAARCCCGRRAMAATALPPLPPQFKSIQHHLRTAQELDKREPVVAYYCECCGRSAAPSRLPQAQLVASRPTPPLPPGSGSWSRRSVLLPPPVGLAGCGSGPLFGAVPCSSR